MIRVMRRAELLRAGDVVDIDEFKLEREPQQLLDSVGKPTYGPWRCSARVLGAPQREPLERGDVLWIEYEDGSRMRLVLTERRLVITTIGKP